MDLLGVTFGTVQLELFAWLNVPMDISTISVQVHVTVCLRGSLFRSLKRAYLAPLTALHVMLMEVALAATIQTITGN